MANMGKKADVALFALDMAHNIDNLYCIEIEMDGSDDASNN